MRIATALFAGLGLQVGLFAVLVPELVASRDLDAGGLGVVLGVLAAASIAALIGGGAVVDRIGRRPLATAGSAGLGLALLALAAVEARWALLPTAVLYGLAGGLLDLGANTIGSDVERVRGEKLMIRLHAGFSGAAAAAALLTAIALSAGVDAASLYAAGGLSLFGLAAWAARARLPQGDRGSGPPSPAGGDRGSDPLSLGAAPRIGGDGDRGSGPPSLRRGDRGSGPASLLALPGVGVAVVLVTLCFFGDGALEGYVALYLRELLGAGALLSGIGLAAFHGASLAGRLASDRAQHRLGERNLITLAGVGAACGMLVVVLAPSAPLAAAGLLVVGASLAPVVLAALSVAGRADPRRAGAAVSLVTTAGYTAFVAGPPLVGALADATSLRIALIPVVVSTALLALAARRL